MLKKLPEVGVARESYAYSQVQDLMTEWVNGGSYKKEVIDFESHTGTLTLPIVEGNVSSHKKIWSSRGLNPRLWRYYLTNVL